MFPFRCSVALRHLIKPNRTRPILCGTAGDQTARAARAPARGCRRYLCTSSGQPTDGKDAANEKRRKAGILPSLEDLLFYTIAEGQDKIPAHKFTT
ncbi:glutaminase a isoform X1, partial [Tachysurus ichikawai]